MGSCCRECSFVVVVFAIDDAVGVVVVAVAFDCNLVVRVAVVVVAAREVSVVVDCVVTVAHVVNVMVFVNAMLLLV